MKTTEERLQSRLAKIQSIKDFPSKKDEEMWTTITLKQIKNKLLNDEELEYMSKYFKKERKGKIFSAWHKYDKEFFTAIAAKQYHGAIDVFIKAVKECDMPDKKREARWLTELRAAKKLENPKLHDISDIKFKWISGQKTFEKLCNATKENV